MTSDKYKKTTNNIHVLASKLVAKFLIYYSLFSGLFEILKAEMQYNPKAIHIKASVLSQVAYDKLSSKVNRMVGPLLLLDKS